MCLKYFVLPYAISRIAKNVLQENNAKLCHSALNIAVVLMNYHSPATSQLTTLSYHHYHRHSRPWEKENMDNLFEQDRS